METLGVGTRREKPSSLPAGLRDDQLEGLGGAGGAGNHAEGSGAGTAQVLVREVEDDLVVGVAVDGGHDAADDAAMREQNLDDRGEAVGGAARVRDDVVLRRVVLVFVDAENEGDVFVGGGSGDDDLFYGRAQVSLGLGGIGKVAGGLDDDLRAYVGPGQLGGIALGPDLDLFAVDGDEVVAGGDFVLQIAKNRVVLEQVGESRRAGQVVNGYKIDLGIAEGGAQNVAANSAKAVDANLHCHEYSPSLWVDL